MIKLNLQPQFSPIRKPQNSFVTQQIYSPTQFSPQHIQTIVRLSPTRTPQKFCPQHQCEELKKICTFINCNKKILLCNQCIFEDLEHVKNHKDMIIPIPEYLMNIDQKKKNALNQNMSDQINLNQEIYNIAFYSEYHSSEFKKYINNEKTKILNDISILEKFFIQKCNELKSKLLKGLDNAVLRMDSLLQDFKKQTNEINQKNQYSLNINPKLYLEEKLFNANVEEISKEFRKYRDNTYLNQQQEQLQNEQKQHKLLDQAKKLTYILQNPPTYQRAEENQIDFKTKIEDIFEYFFSKISTKIQSPTFTEEQGPIEQCEQEQLIADPLPQSQQNQQPQVYNQNYNIMQQAQQLSPIMPFISKQRATPSPSPNKEQPSFNINQRRDNSQSAEKQFNRTNSKTQFITLIKQSPVRISNNKIFSPPKQVVLNSTILGVRYPVQETRLTPSKTYQVQTTTEQCSPSINKSFNQNKEIIKIDSRNNKFNREQLINLVAPSKKSIISENGKCAQVYIKRGLSLSQTPNTLSTNHNGQLNCLCSLGQGLIATGGADGIVKTFNLDKQQLINTFKYHKGAITAMASFIFISEEGQGCSYGAKIQSKTYLATGARDNLVILWDLQNEKESFVLKGNSSTISCITSLGDQRNLATGSLDKNVVIWDIVQRKMVHSTAVNGQIYSIHRLNQQPRFVTSDDSQQITLWRIDYNQQQRRLIDRLVPEKIIQHKFQTFSLGNCISNINNSGILLGGTNNQSIEIWSQHNQFTSSINSIFDYPNDVVDMVVVANEQQPNDYYIIACCKNENKLIIKSSLDNFYQSNIFIYQNLQLNDMFSISKMQIVEHDNSYKLVVVNQNKNNPEIVIWDMIDN